MVTATPAPGGTVSILGSAPGLLPGLLVMALRAAEQHVLVVVGDADLATAERLRRHLSRALAQRPPSLVVELSALDFCDSTGLRVLQEAAGQAKVAGVPLTLRGMSPQLDWLLATFPAPT